MMALGNNMKIDKLIPDNDGDIKIENTIEGDEQLSNKASIDNENVEIESNHRDIIECNETYRVIITPSLRKKVRKVKIEIEGDVSITNIYKIKNEIIPILENYDFIDFNLDKIENLDICCVQLLLAIKMYFNAMEKEVNLKINLPDGLKNIISNAGFKSLLNN